MSEWFNLGLWTNTSDYREAAAALAALVADGIQGGRVLDAGGGGGGLARLLSARGAEVTVVDPAARAADGYRVVQADAAGLSMFESDSFDHVVSLDAAYHFSSRARFLDEAARVLAPGGRLSVVDIAFVAPVRDRHRVLARLAGVPRENLWQLDEVRASLCAFDDVEVRPLEDMLSGFARHGLRNIARFDRGDRAKVAVSAFGLRLQRAVVGVLYQGRSAKGRGQPRGPRR